MKENKVQFIAITAMAVALTYVFTAFVNVRLPIAANGGLIHLGNVVQIAVAAVVVLIVIEPIEIAVKKIGITQFA